MQSAKDFFLSTLGADVPTTMVHHDILVQRVNESEPFGQIHTCKDGRTVLRVGSDLGDGVKVVIP